MTNTISEVVGRATESTIDVTSVTSDDTGQSVFCTSDYAKFTLINGNRVIRMRKVEKLIKSIEQKNLLSCYPIVVTSDMHIIDGQHRYVAAAKLALPIWYVVVTGKVNLDVISLVNNEQNAWTMRDYLHMYQSLGLSQYKSFAGYIDNFGLSVSTGILLWLGQCSDTDKRTFKEGDFPNSGFNTARKVASAVSDLQESIPHCKMYKFCLAYIDVLTHPDYDHKHMLRKLSMTGTFPRCAQASDYIRELERVYNFKSHDKVRFF